jgi:hypothetical protein
MILFFVSPTTFFVSPTTDKVPTHSGEFMHTAVNPYTSRLAVAGAGILTLGLVTAPPNVDAAVSHREVHAVQLAGVTAINMAAVDTAAARTAPVTPTGVAQAATGTSSSASPVALSATTAKAAATSAASVTTTITSAITTIATGVFGIAADVTVGAALLVVVPTIWFLLFPVTFILTGFATVVLSGCGVNQCFTQAAENFLLAPFVPTALALQQAFQQATNIVAQLGVLFNGAAAAPAARAVSSAAVTAAASPATDSSATDTDPRSRVRAIARPHADLRVKPQSVSTKGAVDTTDAVDAVEAKSAPRAAAVADSDNTPNSTPTRSVKAGKTGTKAPAHRAADSVGKHRKN